MQRVLSLSMCAIFAFAALGAVFAADKKEEKKVPEVFKFKMKKLDGKDADLSAYNGKVVLFVNVASQCGYTPQYKGLEALYEKYSDKGLVVVGVPANDFGKQEPGTNDEIADFCKKNYGVKFDMLAKVTVKGDDKCDLYKYLVQQETKWNSKGEVKWNFEKFLIGRDGKVAGRFGSGVDPESDELSEAIEKELEKK